MKLQYCTAQCDRLSFGKYKGESIYEVLQKDSRYLIWLHKNSILFNLSDDILRIAYSWANRQLANNRLTDEIAF